MATGVEESKVLFEYAVENNAVIKDIIYQKNNDCTIDVALTVQLGKEKKGSAIEEFERIVYKLKSTKRESVRVYPTIVKSYKMVYNVTG